MSNKSVVSDIAAVLTFKSDDKVNRQNLHYAGNRYRARALLRSIERFAPAAFAQILIVCPQPDMILAKEISSNIDLNVEVIDEKALLPSPYPLQEVPSWYRQQICKLMSYTLSSCPYILQLDPDMIVRRPVRRDDFFIDCKILTQLEQTSHRIERWTGAAEIVGFKGDIPAFGLSVTPALLSSQICQDLAERLQFLYGSPAAFVLADKAPRDWKRTWTEYACYTLSAMNAGTWEKFHHLKSRTTIDQPAMFAAKNVWLPGDESNVDPAIIFDEKDRGIFFVFQSAAGLDYQIYLDLISQEIRI